MTPGLNEKPREVIAGLKAKGGDDHSFTSWKSWAKSTKRYGSVLE